MTVLETSPAPTKVVYQHDETIRIFPATIVLIRPLSELSENERSLFKTATINDSARNTYVVEVDQTIFYAQGGGQPCDIGYMKTDGARFRVESVRYSGSGRILHLGTFEKQDIAQPAIGDMVEQAIDGERRDTNSRCHTAGHVIGLAVRRLMETERSLESVAELKASHFPDASFVEFTGLIDGKFKASIQSQAMEYVKRSLPIRLHWYKPEQLSEKGVITNAGMPIVAGPDGKVRVVDIEGAGAYPCGGTHVQETSLVGTITVKSIKRQKGVSKVSYTVS